MAELISLDDSSYDGLYESAMEKIRSQAPWWTHREVSDPGIMLIEMWALLADMQSYYLDRIQESHYRKYLKLLGISPDEGECARAWVFFEFEEEAQKECIIPRGTKLLSDQMVFETEEEVRLIKNRFSGFFQGTYENRADAMQLFRKNRFVLEEEREQRRELFTFVLDQPLEQRQDFSFFVLLDERGQRNPVEDDFGMVRLVWEYQLSGRWRKAGVVRDDTMGLLFSGMITLRLDPRGSGAGGIYAIRCRIGQGSYDVMPVLYKICLNAVRVLQRDTLCCEEVVDFTENRHRVALRSYLGKTGSLWFLKKTGDQGKLWEDITEEVCVDAPVTADRRERYVSYPGTGRVKVVCTADRNDPLEFMAQVTGIAAQKIPLPWKKLMRSSVKLVIRQPGEEKKLYRSYHMADPEETRYRKIWHWEEEENVIVLGDGRHGEIPQASEDGMRLTAISLWEGEKGNVPVNRITKWQRPELFPHITCTNYMTGRDGRSRRKPSLQFEEIQGELLRQNRMVTEADIQALALETPGLMIRKSTVLWEDNTIVVGIFPAYPLKERYCVEWYRSRVEKYLSPYRLAGTKIRVEVHGESESD